MVEGGIVQYRLGGITPPYKLAYSLKKIYEILMFYRKSINYSLKKIFVKENRCEGRFAAVSPCVGSATEYYYTTTIITTTILRLYYYYYYINTPVILLLLLQQYSSYTTIIRRAKTIITRSVTI